MGHSRRALTPKIRALADAEGCPVRAKPTPGRSGDAPVGGAFVAALDPGLTSIPDRARDAGPT